MLPSGRKARHSLLTSWVPKGVKSQSLRVKPVTPPVKRVVMVPPKPSKKQARSSLSPASLPTGTVLKHWMSPLTCCNVATNVSTNVLQRNPNIKAIYCANDTMAMGVAQAVANAGKTGKVLVVGTDGIPEARKMVEAGQMTATVAQNPADIGATGLKLMVDAEKSGKVIPLDKAPEFKLVDSILVTQ